MHALIIINSVKKDREVYSTVCIIIVELHFMQNPDCMEACFHVLYDNVQMSDFVKRAIGVIEFDNGRAYYEFTQTEEDLVFYKEVVRMHKVMPNN